MEAWPLLIKIKVGPEWAEEVPQSGPHLPGEGFRVPDVKYLEGQSGREERGGLEGAIGEEKQETGRRQIWCLWASL